MKKALNIILTVALLVLPSLAGAEVVETHEQKVTPTGVVVDTTYVTGEGSDSLAVGDPYGNRPLPAGALQGPGATQKSYGPGCTDALCERARQRQLSSPHWSPQKQ